MVKNSQRQSGNVLVVVIIIVLALLGVLGFIFWQNFIHKEPTTAKTETITKTQTQTPAIPNNWIKFSDATLGLSFSYPDSWGEAKLEVMNPQPDELNKTFYKISFGSKNRIVTITPKASLQAWTSTVANIKESIKDFPDSRYVLVNESDYVAIIVPSMGNQTSSLYAGKMISLPKIDADAIILFDAKDYGSSALCKADAYVSCYSDADRGEIKLFLQELKAK